MESQEKEQILDRMYELGKSIDTRLDTKTQSREDTTYYRDFTFGKSGLAEKNVYIVEIANQKQKDVGDKKQERTKGNEEDSYSTYEIYDEDSNLIATVDQEGKIHFSPEYLEKLKDIDEAYFNTLQLEDIDFEKPEELRENDLHVSKEELSDYKEKKQEKENGLEPQREEDKQEKNKDEEEQKHEEQEGEEEKREKTAEALGIKKEDIKSISTIDPRQKITEQYNLVDIMPEAAEYTEISITCTNPTEKSNGTFTMIGIRENGTREVMNSIEPVEGTTGNKSVISINEDGSEVTEKQVKGLLRINARSRMDGIAISIGDYGMMDIDYVSNITDKETRRAIPIRTKDAQNQRIATSEVREQGGDSRQEVRQEGEIFREKEEQGVDPQTIDGIDIDEADGGEMTVEEMKKQIKEATIEQGEMSKGETEAFIKSQINQSGLTLSEGERELITQEIERDVVDELRFETRGERH